MTIENVAGKEATVHFDAQKCIHSRTCVLSHPDVFVPNVKGEWIHPDAQPVEALMHIAKSCPSGAIRVTRNAAGGAAPDSDAAPIVNTVRVRENGPLAIEAELQIGGVAQASPRATLCRCGLSQNKPYCDGSHTAGGFVASGEPPAASFEALAVRNGPLNVMPLPNGPLKVVGNLEVVSGTGRTCNKVGESYLCRCGASKNKSYCDGAHKAAGFAALHSISPFSSRSRASMPRTIAIHGLHHNAYRCRDSEVTRQFYEDFLGLPLAGTLEINETKSGRPTRTLHTFYQMGNGSYLAYFEAPDMPFEFKDQHDFDLHIALEVDLPTLQSMLAKGKAAGLPVRGVSDHEFIQSIYFRDPNGYVIELTTRLPGHDAAMDPATNGARAKLDKWTVAKRASA